MQSQENNVYYAGFFVRLAAAVLDELFIGIILLFVKIPMVLQSMGGLTGSPLFSEVLFHFTMWDILFYMLAKGYFIVTTYSAGATLGKKLMKVKVVSSDSRSLTLWNILYRETIGKYLSGLLFWIGYIIIGIDREKRAFHDMLSDTRVIYNFHDLQIADVHDRDTGICEFRSSKKEKPDNNTFHTTEQYPKNDVEIYYRKPEITPKAPEDSQKVEPKYEAATYGYDSGRQDKSDDERQNNENKIADASEHKAEYNNSDSTDQPEE